MSDAVEVPLRCGFKLTIGEKIKILVKLAGGADDNGRNR